MIPNVQILTSQSVLISSLLGYLKLWPVTESKLSYEVMTNGIQPSAFCDTHMRELDSSRERPMVSLRSKELRLYTPVQNDFRSRCVRACTSMCVEITGR